MFQIGDMVSYYPRPSLWQRLVNFVLRRELKPQQYVVTAVTTSDVAAERQ